MKVLILRPNTNVPRDKIYQERNIISNQMHEDGVISIPTWLDYEVLDIDVPVFDTTYVEAKPDPKVDVKFCTTCKHRKYMGSLDAMTPCFNCKIPVRDGVVYRSTNWEPKED